MPWSPVNPKNTLAKAPCSGVKFSTCSSAYSRICSARNVSPMISVNISPSVRPRRLPRFIDTSAQCIVNEDEIRIAVLIAVESTGISNGSGGYTG